MQKLHFSIEIKAPRGKVWDVMLADTSYREWTAAFHAGSYYDGSWQKGEKIKFLAPDENGILGGMVSEIAENREHEFISIHHRGMIMNGVEDTTSDMAKAWGNAYENYTFIETPEGTKLDIDVDTDESMVAVFNDMWPKALESLKKIVERA